MDEDLDEDFGEWNWARDILGEDLDEDLDEDFGEWNWARDILGEDLDEDLDEDCRSHTVGGGAYVM